jgi:hypothetical protein
MIRQTVCYLQRLGPESFVVLDRARESTQE